MNTPIHRRRLLAGSLAATLLPARFASGAPASPSAVGISAQEQGTDWEAVAQALGKPGQLMEGDVFRVGMPRSDLDVTVRDVALEPAFALGSYAAFKQVGPTAADTMAMGDLVLLDAELNGVMSGLFEAGLSVTGVHNHLNEITPHVMYMHYMGMGEPVALAQGLAQALSASATPLGEVPSGTPAAAATPTTELPTSEIEETLGHAAKVVNGGVVQVSAPRAEPITDGDVELLPTMGVATVLNFQSVGGGQAAVTGDFLLLAAEVNPVAQALRGNGIEVHALHNHHLTEEPRYFYMHFFASGDPPVLAAGLRAALDQTNSKPA